MHPNIRGDSGERHGLLHDGKNSIDMGSTFGGKPEHMVCLSVIQAPFQAIMTLLRMVIDPSFPYISVTMSAYIHKMLHDLAAYLPENLSIVTLQASKRVEWVCS